jgi:hypothetical protein
VSRDGHISPPFGLNGARRDDREHFDPARSIEAEARCINAPY